MKEREGRIFARGKKGILWIAWWDDGREHRESTKSADHRVAERKLRDKLAAKDKGEAVVPGAQRVTVGRLAEMCGSITRLQARSRGSVSHSACGTLSSTSVQTDGRRGSRTRHSKPTSALAGMIRPRRQPCASSWRSSRKLSRSRAGAGAVVLGPYSQPFPFETSDRAFHRRGTRQADG